jgi:hypothetical protein
VAIPSYSHYVLLDLPQVHFDRIFGNPASSNACRRDFIAASVVYITMIAPLFGLVSAVLGAWHCVYAAVASVIFIMPFAIRPYLQKKFDGAVDGAVAGAGALPWHIGTAYCWMGPGGAMCMCMIYVYDMYMTCI